MSGEPPVLILGFNRPEFTKKVFQGLKNSKPRTVLFAVDGPRDHVKNDKLKVAEVQKTIEMVDWNAEIQTRFRSKNLGLKEAVVDSVSWAISEFGRVVVLEDDAVPGPNFFNYMKQCLNVFENEPQVGHISGYNCVPPKHISDTGLPIRLSQYPESYAWGTWERAWKHYENEISIEDLNGLISSWVSKQTWREYFYQAQEELISTWAFRWIHALWLNNLRCISPNVNLVDYIGHENGTHTRSRPRYKELKIAKIENEKISTLPNLDFSAEDWIKKTIFRERLYGLLDLKSKTLALKAIKRYEKFHNHYN